MGRQEWLLLPLKGAANEKALDLTTGFTDYLGGNISVDRNVDADTADADALLMAGQECQRLRTSQVGRQGRTRDRENEGEIHIRFWRQHHSAPRRITAMTASSAPYVEGLSPAAMRGRSGRARPRRALRGITGSETRLTTSRDCWMLEACM